MFRSSRINYQSFRLSDLELYSKEASRQMFTSKYCEISKNIYFEEHMRTTASELYCEKVPLSHLRWSVCLLLQLFALIEFFSIQGYRDEEKISATIKATTSCLLKISNKH